MWKLSQSLSRGLKRSENSFVFTLEFSVLDDRASVSSKDIDNRISWKRKQPLVVANRSYLSLCPLFSMTDIVHNVDFLSTIFSHPAGSSIRRKNDRWLRMWIREKRWDGEVSFSFETLQFFFFFFFVLSCLRNEERKRRRKGGRKKKAIERNDQRKIFWKRKFRVYEKYTLFFSLSIINFLFLNNKNMRNVYTLRREVITINENCENCLICYGCHAIVWKVYFTKRLPPFCILYRRTFISRIHYRLSKKEMRINSTRNSSRPKINFTYYYISFLTF